eukprot:1179780-Prorocentrum_minimum.AAC.1
MVFRRHLCICFVVAICGGLKLVESYSASIQGPSSSEERSPTSPSPQSPSIALNLLPWARTKVDSLTLVGVTQKLMRSTERQFLRDAGSEFQCTSADGPFCFVRLQEEAGKEQATDDERNGVPRHAAPGDKAELVTELTAELTLASDSPLGAKMVEVVGRAHFLELLAKGSSLVHFYSVPTLLAPLPSPPSPLSLAAGPP